MKNCLIVISTVLVLLLGWELFSYLNEDFLFVLPAPSAVFARLIDHFPRFLHHTKITVQEMFGGFILALLGAFPMAWLMDHVKSARAIFQPLFVIIECIPMFTLAPIMVIWFGWTSMAIIVPTALMIFFPLTITIYKGLRAVPEELLDYFRVNRATPWQLLFKLKLPWSLPHIFGGFRLAAAIAGVAAVAGEWAGAQEGLGVLMVESRRDTDLETCFGALFCLTAVSWVFYLAAVGCESLATVRISWKGLLKKMSTFATVCLSLTGCQSSDSISDKVLLTLDWLPNPNHVPLYVGIKKGYFMEEGIDLYIQKIQDPGHTTPYLMSGQSDLALSYMPHMVRFNRQNKHVKFIGVLIQEPQNAIIYPANAAIHTPQDLTGKIIGCCSGGKETVMLSALLAKNGVLPAELRLTRTDPVAFLATAKVDALYGAYWNIETEHLRSLGIETKFFKLAELGLPHYAELIVLIKEGGQYDNPTFIQHFQMALQKSIDYSKNHSEEAFRIYAESQPDKSLKTKEWEKRAWEKTIPTLAERQQISMEIFADFEKWLKAHHIM